MDRNTGISAVEYQLEWIDHLYELYGEFGRRNDLNEWIVFFRRPEMADPHEHDKIAAGVLKYLTKYEHISQGIVKYIESVFKYCDSEKKYEDVIGFEAMELYRRYLLGTKEFPPYDLFDGYDDEKDYDGFVAGFRNLYFSFGGSASEEYKAQLENIKDFEIEHPYMALLDSEYYVMCKAYPAALSCLSDMEDGYYKFMNMGMVFETMGASNDAERCYEAAVAEREINIDPVLIRNYIMCKYHNGKQEEALRLANDFAEKGYEFVVLPMKQSFLEEICGILSEKSKPEDFSERECLIMKEYYMLRGDYEAVIEMGRMSRDRGFEDGSWTVDMAEAYFEMKEYEQAQSIVDMVYDGRKKLKTSDLMKIREIKARLLFANGRPKAAYEIMWVLCGRADSTMKQKFILAKMYEKTGRLKDAIEILSLLRFDSPWNITYTYELAKCLLDNDDNERAYTLFVQVFNTAPGYMDSAYYVVQSVIDSGDMDKAEETLNMLKEYIPECYRKYLMGQIAEMNEEYGEAKDIYYEMVQDYKKEPFDRKLLYDAYFRYFIMREELGARVMTLLPELENAVAKYPKASLLWYFLGDLYERTGFKISSAGSCYEKALRADPYNDSALLNLANIYAEANRWSQVYRLSDMLVTNTDSAEAYLIRARSCLEMGNTEQCMKDIAVYEAKGGDKKERAEICGKLAIKTGNYEKALEHFEYMLKNKAHDDIPCYDDIAICMCKLGRFFEAVEMLDTVCESSKNCMLHILLYEIEKYCGLFKEAKDTLKRYRKVCGISRIDDDYEFLQASLMAESGKSVIALKFAESIASYKGERLCGILETVLGNSSAAVRIFKKLIKREPDEIDNYSWLAFALHLKDAFFERNKYAAQGIEIFENYYGKTEKLVRPNLLCQYGFLKTMCGDGEAAEEAFNKALNMSTCGEYICEECYEAYYGLGIYHGCYGRQKEAKKCFEKSLEIKPHNFVCQSMLKRLKKG